jgi:hypothetical protein
MADAAGIKQDCRFKVILESSDSPRSMQIAADLLSIRVEQRAIRAGAAGVWNSVSVYCEEEPSGALLVRVLVFSPDWDGPLQIGALRSWPREGASELTFACNLDHVAT